MASATIEELLHAARERLDRVDPAAAIDALRSGAVMIDTRRLPIA